jgi:phospholipid transport system transporter-binding protein
MKQRKAPRKKPGSTKRTPAVRKRTVSRPFALAADCAIGSAGKLKTDLLRRLKQPGSVAIDASALQRIDTATLQVLVAFARDRGAAGRPVEWVGVPAVLSDAARLLNLTATLGLAAPADAPVPA